MPIYGSRQRPAWRVGAAWHALDRSVGRKRSRNRSRSGVCRADIAAANVLCTVETADRQHIEDLYRSLTAEGIRVLPIGVPVSDAPSTG